MGIGLLRVGRHMNTALEHGTGPIVQNVLVKLAAVAMPVGVINIGGVVAMLPAAHQTDTVERAIPTRAVQQYTNFVPRQPRGPDRGPLDSVATTEAPMIDPHSPPVRP